MLSVSSKKLLNKISTIPITQTRWFSILIPNKQLHFIHHPIHGTVYPIACYHKDSIHPRKKSLIISGISMINLGALYSLFIESIFQSTFLAFTCNPLFLLPSLGLNYLIATEYSIMFYARRSMCINLYLKQNGKQIIAETYGGEYRTINIKDIYKFEVVRSRLRQSDRLQINHGANQFLFLRAIVNSWTQRYLMPSYRNGL